MTCPNGSASWIPAGRSWCTARWVAGVPRQWISYGSRDSAGCTTSREGLLPGLTASIPRFPSTEKQCLVASGWWSVASNSVAKLAGRRRLLLLSLSTHSFPPRLSKIADSRLFRINGLGGNCSQKIDSKCGYTYPCLPVGVSGHFPAHFGGRGSILGIVKELYRPTPRREPGGDTSPPASQIRCKGWRRWNARGIGRRKKRK